MKTFTGNEMREIVETVLLTTRDAMRGPRGAIDTVVNSAIFDMYLHLKFELGRSDQTTWTTDEAREFMHMGLLRTPSLPMGYGLNKTQSRMDSARAHAKADFNKFFDSL